MAIVWLTRDHRGREVALTEATATHILERRPAMVGRWDEVKRTVEDPEFVRRDRRISAREVFYRRTAPGRARLRVVVHCRPVPPQGTWRGEVVTAHPAERTAANEEPLWP